MSGNLFAPTFRYGGLSNPDIGSGVNTILKSLQVPGQIAKDLEAKKLRQKADDRATQLFDLKMAEADRVNKEREATNLVNQIRAAGPQVKPGSVTGEGVDFGSMTEDQQAAWGQQALANADRESTLDVFKRALGTASQDGVVPSEVLNAYETAVQRDMQNRKADERFDWQKEKYQDAQDEKDLQRQELAKVFKELNSVGTTQEAYKPSEIAQYEKDRRDVETYIGSLETTLKALDPDSPAQAKYRPATERRLAAAKKQLESLEKPSSVEVSKSRQQYVADLMGRLKDANITDPTVLQLVNSELKNRANLLGDNEDGLTKYQKYKVAKDRKDELSEFKTARQTLVDTVGKTSADKYLKENPNTTAEAVKEYAKRRSEFKKSTGYPKLTEYVAEAGFGSGGEIVGMNDVEVLKKLKELGKKYKVSDSYLTSQFKLANEGTWTDKGAIDVLEDLLKK